MKDEEQGTFAFFDMTPDLICIAGKDGFFKKINPAVTQKLGYTKEELFSRPIFSFMHPEDRERTGGEREKLLKGTHLLNLQNRYCTKSGEVVWLEWTSVYVPDKEIVFAIAKDITSRKLMEQEIEEKYKKFKSLATHFKNTIEKDRKFLAMELHEELAQLATAVKLDINFISAGSPSMNETVKNRVAHALAVSDLLITTIRRISFAISPNMLDDMGLNEVMKWLCGEFSSLNGIPCYYECAFDEAMLPQEIQLDIFRICQESLSNVMYHAEARKVIIRMEEINNTIALTISDDGKGFEIDTKKQAPGLTSIRERVASINGKLVVDTQPGKGTRICVIIGKE